MPKQNYKLPSAQMLSVHAARRRMTVEQLITSEGLTSLDALNIWCAVKNVIVPEDAAKLFKKKKVEPVVVDEPEQKPRRKAAIVAADEKPTE